MTIPGMPDWALPDSYPPPVQDTPVLELARAQALARVPPAPGYGSDWDWERFMGTALMPGVPVTLPNGQIVLPRADGSVVPVGEPQPGLTFVPTATGGLWIKTDPPPGVPLIQALPNGDVLVLPLAHPSVAGQAGVYTDDAAAINAAAIQAGGSYGYGGRLRLGPWVYNLQSPTVIPQQSTLGQQGFGPVSVLGVHGATRLAQNFAGIGMYAHRSSGYGAQANNPDQKPLGELKGFTIDMTGAGPGSIGLDCGDGWWLDVDCEVVNGTSQPAVTFNNATNTFTLTGGGALPVGFPVMLLSGTYPGGGNLVGGTVYYVVNPAGSTFQLARIPGGSVVTGNSNGSGLTIGGAIGLHYTNQVFWSEKQRMRYQSKHNAICAILDTMVPASDRSHEYLDVDINMWCDAGQQGVVLATGVNFNGRGLFIHGNMQAFGNNVATPPGNIAMLTISGTDGGANSSRLYQTHLRCKVEGNNSANFANPSYPYGLFSDTNGYIKQTDGHISHSLGTGATGGVPSFWGGGEFSFSGPMTDSSLADLVPSTPTSQATLIPQNYQTTATVVNIALSPGPAYPAGTAVQFPGGSVPGGFAGSTTYYVVNPGGNNIQLSATPGGAAITPTTTVAGTFVLIAPPMPASGTIQQNYGPDMLVCVTGGNVTGISVLADATGLTSGAFFVGAGASITINYTVAPTWVWIPCRQMVY